MRDPEDNGQGFTGKLTMLDGKMGRPRVTADMGDLCEGGSIRLRCLPRERKVMTGTPLLERPKQLSERTGLSVSQIRTLIRTRRLDCVRVGCRDFIPAGAFEKFVEEGRTKSWEDEIKVPVSVGSKSALLTTSSGLSTVAAASAALARQTANKLKSSSPNGSNSEEGGTAQVIPPQCS